MTSTSEPNSNSIVQRLKNARIGARHDLHVSRQMAHNGVAYNLHDPLRFSSHQISAKHYQIFAALSDKRPLSDLFGELVQRRILLASEEEEFYQVIVHLNQVGLLELPVQNGKTLYEKYKRRIQSQRSAGIASWLFRKVPLFRSDAFLDRTVHWIRPLFGRLALVIWLAAVAACGMLLVQRWRDFTDPLDSLLTSGNLLVLWLLLVLLKVFHEFGHAYACKHFGGTVPEMGLFFMLLTPCAYVDASSAWTFSSRWQRIVVSLAGVYFESWIALCAFFYWCFASPSDLKSLAHYAFMLSSLVTIGFNINPFMRYDGYYVLTDLVNLPNLRTQAMGLLRMFSKYILFGLPLQLPAALSRSGIAGLAAYGLVAKCYRWMVSVGILALIITRFPTIGFMVSAGVIAWSLMRLGLRTVMYLRFAAELEGRRTRAFVVAGSLFCMGSLAVVGLPTPRRTNVIGILEREHDVVVRAETNGFLAPSQVDEGTGVEQGDILCQLVNDEMKSLVEQQRAIVSMLQMEVHHHLERQDDVAAESAQREFQQARKDLLNWEHRQSQEQVRANIPGALLETERLRNEGEFIDRGDPLVRISSGAWTLKALVPDDDFSRTRIAVGQPVTIRLAGTGGKRHLGRILSISQAGDAQIPDIRLTQLADGPIPVHEETMSAQRPYFEVRVEILDTIAGALHGMRGTASLPCEWERIAVDLYRVSLLFWHRLRVAS